ncbi:hypothetical protein [Serratia marcescens]|uniref:hypothetical protein n=1 Tax=Serratia marcescens TaxID=615 RepID=UPI003F7FDC54
MEKFWSIIKSSEMAAFLAVFGIVFGLYQTFIYEKKGQLDISMIPLTRVFDIHKSIGGLEISYEGESLRKNNQALWIVSVNVENSGNAEINKNSYDGDAPLGLIIDGGKIVDTPTVTSTDSYIRENIKYSATDKEITFSPIIIDANSGFTTNLLVLGFENKKPSVSIKGKIAGIKELHLRKLDDENVRNTVWYREIFAPGIWWVQLSRMVLYAISFILSLIILAFMIAYMGSIRDNIKKRKDKSKRQEKINKYKQDDAISKERRVISEIYIAKGNIGLLSAYNSMKTAVSRAQTYEKLEGKIDNNDLRQILKGAHPLDWREKNHYSELIERNVISFGDDDIKPLFNENTLDEFTSLIEYLELNIEKENSNYGILEEHLIREYKETM